MPFPCSDIKLAQMNKAQVRKYVQVPSNLCVTSNPIINFNYKRGHRQELSIFFKQWPSFYTTILGEDPDTSSGHKQCLCWVRTSNVSL